MRTFLRSVGAAAVVLIALSVLADSAAASTCEYAVGHLDPTCGSNFSAIEGQQFDGAVGSVTNVSFSNGVVALRETVTVEWGDGAHSRLDLPLNPTHTTSVEDVTAAHRYSEAGEYAVTVTSIAHFYVLGVEAGSTPLASGSSLATVTDAPLTAAGSTFKASLRKPFSGTVATFTDANPDAPASDFTATIEWGDGSEGAGEVVATSDGFAVTGGHAYTDPALADSSLEGNDAPVGVRISDRDGATAKADSHVHVPLLATRAEVPIGSVAPAALPAGLSEISAIDPSQAGAEPGVSVSASEGQAIVAASSEAAVGEMTVELAGTACTVSKCGVPFDMELPVTVTPIAAPPGNLEAFTQPSPDRVAAANEGQLDDELLIAVGTPQKPGSRALADAAAAAAGGSVSGGLEDVGIYEVRWPGPQDLTARTAQLEAQPGVGNVSPSSVREYVDENADHVADVFDTPQWLWPYRQIDAQAAWSQSTASDTKVGIIDIGNIDPHHEDLHVVQTINGLPPADHATHVAGLACARGDNELGMVGLGWGCPLVSEGVQPALDKDLLTAMSAMTQVPGVRVVNVSLGRESSSGGCVSLDQAATIQREVAAEKQDFAYVLAGRLGAEIVWTFSAGNNCVPGVASAGAENSDLHNVFAVAATNSDKSLARFSDYGYKVNVAAPGGVNVDFFPRTGLMSTTVNSTYNQMSGTSMAAPIVAGVAALMISAEPSITAGQVKKCILATAGTGDTGFTTGQGADPMNFYPPLPYVGQPLPIVNAAAAVACAKQPNGGGGTPPPAAPVSAGFAHSCAIHGGLYCWGQNFWGQLGDGTMAGSATPHAVEGLSGALSIATGTNSSCALLAGGHVECWGGGGYGQLGNGQTGDSSVPVPVSGISNAVQLDVGGLTACALLKDGRIECWGFDSDGQLGNAAPFENWSFSPTPVPVYGITDAVDLSVGYNHACALLADGAIKCWGRGTSGQLGNGAQLSSSTPVTVNGAAGAIAVSAGGSHTCSLLTGGYVDCWGSNSSGQLGNGTTTGSSTPIQVSGLANATSVSAGRNHTCAVLASGGIECWGANEWGQLGNPDGSSHKPVAVNAITTATDVSAGGFHTCAKLADGTLDCWGRNSEGQLGNGTTTPSTTPVVVNPFP